MEYAMVQAIENRADVEGRILAIRPDAERPEHRLATIEVGAVIPVEGYPNLFARTSGSSLDVILPAHLPYPTNGADCRFRRKLHTALTLADRDEELGDGEPRPSLLMPWTASVISLPSPWAMDTNCRLVAMSETRMVSPSSSCDAAATLDCL
jgi:hypothetical protein